MSSTKAAGENAVLRLQLRRARRVLKARHAAMERFRIRSIELLKALRKIEELSQAHDGCDGAESGCCRCMIGEQARSAVAKAESRK